MAQSLKQKLIKLADQFNIDAIIQTAQEVKLEQTDTQAWQALTTDEKTDWFMQQCAKYNLSAKIVDSYRIIVKELPCGDNAYFTVFLPRNETIGSDRLSQWKLEIGGSYFKDVNGGIWSTAPGLKGKERQIAEVMRLHNLGE
jgi:hypothetical protein